MVSTKTQGSSSTAWRPAIGEVDGVLPADFGQAIGLARDVERRQKIIVRRAREDIQFFQQRYVEVAGATISFFPERLDDVIDRFGNAVRAMTGRGLPTQEFPIGEAKTIEVTRLIGLLARFGH